MSASKDRLVTVLERIADRLDAIEDEQHAARRHRRDVGEVIAQVADDTSTIRVRLLTEADRLGTEIRRHEQALIEHEARLHRIERPIDGHG